LTIGGKRKMKMIRKKTNFNPKYMKIFLNMKHESLKILLLIQRLGIIL
jgi:hypothetical protein